MRKEKRLQTDRIEVRESPIHDKGVFALERIPRAARIIEYRGTRRDWESCNGEERDYVCLFHVNDTVVIDPRRRGNAARFINHSCKPNCQAVMDGERIFIESLRSIAPGEELFYDYSLTMGGRFTRPDVIRHPCYCGTRRCRGTMLAVPPHRMDQVRRWVAAAEQQPPGA